MAANIVTGLNAAAYLGDLKINDPAEPPYNGEAWLMDAPTDWNVYTRGNLLAVARHLQGVADSDGLHGYGFAPRATDPYPAIGGMGTGVAHLWWDSAEDTFKFRVGGNATERELGATPVGAAEGGVTAVANSLISGDLLSPDWDLHGVTNRPKVAPAIEIKGGVYLNADGAAAGIGAMATPFVAPAGVTQVQFSVPLKLPTGVGSSEVVLQVLSSALVVLSTLTATVTGAEVVYSTPVTTVTPNAHYICRILTNSAVGANNQARVIAGKPTVAVTVGSFLAGSYTRWSFDPKTVRGNIQRERYLDASGLLGKWMLTFAAALQVATADEVIHVTYVDTSPDVNNAFTVWVNGRFHSQPAAVDLVRDSYQHTIAITLPAGPKLVEIRDGGKYTIAMGDAINEGSLRGCSVVAVFAATGELIPPKVTAKNLFAFGDSVLHGFYATAPGVDDAVSIVRARFEGTTFHGAINSGCSKRFIDTAAATLDFVDELAAANITHFLWEHFLNEQVIASWGVPGVAEFQARLQFFLRALVRRIPWIRVYVSPGIGTNDEASVNAQGENLAVYRTALSNAVTAVALPNNVRLMATPLAYAAAKYFNERHPNGIGQREMGENFAAAVTAVWAGSVDIAAALAVASGGTGLTALGTALQVLRVNAGGTALEYAAAGGGSGTVTSVAAGNTSITIGGTPTVAPTVTLNVGNSNAWSVNQTFSVGLDVASVHLDGGTFSGVTGIRLGAISGTPVSNGIIGTGGSGTDIEGGSLILAAGPGTGTGSSGDVVLYGNAPAASGSTISTLVAQMRMTKPTAVRAAAWVPEANGGGDSIGQHLGLSTKQWQNLYLAGGVYVGGVLQTFGGGGVSGVQSIAAAADTAIAAAKGVYRLTGGGTVNRFLTSSLVAGVPFAIVLTAGETIADNNAAGGGYTGFQTNAGGALTGTGVAGTFVYDDVAGWILQVGYQTTSQA